MQDSLAAAAVEAANVPLADVIEKVEQRGLGRVIEIHPEPVASGFVYGVETLAPDGSAVRLSYSLDARFLRIDDTDPDEGAGALAHAEDLAAPSRALSQHGHGVIFFL